MENLKLTASILTLDSFFRTAISMRTTEPEEFTNNYSKTCKKTHDATSKRDQ
jgi:hypothetical protein